LGLDVVVDDAPHANITGLPLAAEDKLMAESLASRLAREARLVPDQPSHAG
jgi:hypothetical protein